MHIVRIRNAQLPPVVVMKCMSKERSQPINY